MPFVAGTTGDPIFSVESRMTVPMELLGDKVVASDTMG